ncbi:MAG: molybdate transport system ATP-binding protein [Planctomycetota bacterium]|jgi:molybdate transport system ATP-binding protein
MIEALLRQTLGQFHLDVSFRSSGPVLGVFGQSGSGKTSLLHAIAGMLRPKEARLIVGGKTLVERPGSTWVPPDQRRIGFVPQEALLFPHLSTRDNLLYSPHIENGLNSSFAKELLSLLRLGPLLDRQPRDLSGGEKQRVALGRALLARPRLLLLDEPAASLDNELARGVLALLLEAKRVLEVPMIFVTHRPSELIALADDCVVLEEGRVVAQGAPMDVLSRPHATGVARLAGVDNLLRLQVHAHDETGGITLLALGSAELAVPFLDAELGEHVDVGIYAEDVILCLDRPTAISARNALDARVTALEGIDRERLVHLDVGGQNLLARVTPSAEAALGLRSDLKLVALIKTTACHLLS